MGKLYLSETGIITFKSRIGSIRSSVYDFDAYNNINDLETKKEDDLINVVEAKGKEVELQPNQKYWELSGAVKVPAGESVDIWADFDDPVTSCDTPIYITSATTSLFSVNTAEDGSGSPDSTNVTLASSSLFAKSYKMTFTNGGASDLYLIAIELYTTPIKTLSDIYVREQDDDSVAKYGEKIFSVDNDFIQNKTDALSLAAVILREYAEYRLSQRLDVKGTPALQVDDPVKINLFDVINNYKITKITDRMSLPAKYTQILEVKKQLSYTYFAIESSEIDGVDVISP